jgi:hypothetical protein
MKTKTLSTGVVVKQRKINGVTRISVHNHKRYILTGFFIALFALIGGGILTLIVDLIQQNDVLSSLLMSPFFMFIATVYTLAVINFIKIIRYE